MSNMRQDLNSILDGDDFKGGIIQKLEELKAELGAKMEIQLKPKYRADVSNYDVCTLPGLVTGNDKLILSFMMEVKLASTGTLMNRLLINKVTISRSLNRLVEEGYLIKVKGGTYELAKTNIF